jgi:ribulose 1,5-bisphosphate synthetase/thiazole synthase
MASRKYNSSVLVRNGLVVLHVLERAISIVKNGITAGYGVRVFNPVAFADIIEDAERRISSLVNKV